MSDIRVLIVVDGIFSLTTTYPIDPTVPPFGPEADPTYGADAWFTLSHLIKTLRNNPSPTFTVDTASRGFNAAGNFDAGTIVNTVPDPDATLAGPFHFDDPNVDLSVYDEIWIFSDEGYDGGPIGPAGPGDPGGITDSELTAITKFMDGGGGVFATGDHDGLGSAVGGRIPRVRYMRKWYSPNDASPGIPPLAVTNWPGVTEKRRDTLQQSPTDVGSTFFFDDQSDDIPQPLTVLVPSHPVVQGATGVLKVYPDHMHEGEVIAPTGLQLTQTSASDPTLSFAPAGFTEFPTVGGWQESPIILAQVSVGTGGGLAGHKTMVGEAMVCENKNFGSDASTCDTGTNDTLAAYDGHIANVGRIVTDSSFHHFLDLNLLGDPCSNVAAKQQGFNASASGKAVLKEIEAFYVKMAIWLAWTDTKFYFVMGKNNYGRDEVNDNLTYSAAFYLFLEGYSPNVVGPNPKPTLSGTFKTNIPGLSISDPAVSYDVGDTGTAAHTIQRIRFEYTVTFSAASLTAPGVFPAPGGAPNPFTLAAKINIQGQAFPSLTAEFFLLGGDDPYFANINDAARNVSYLSQDLRVFTGTPAINNVPVNGPGLPDPSLTPPVLSDSFPGAYTYIRNLITWLNKQYGYLNTSFTPPDTNIFDPLDALLPHQNGALNGDSSVTPKTGPNNNYNFAIARVRLKGASGPANAAQNVKVFFRIFTTQTFDTDYINVPSAVTTADPNVTYRSTGSANDPQSPLPGTDGSGTINGCSLPFFATDNFNNSPSDYASGGANNQNIEISTGDYTWAFYGCFLNVNDASNEFGSPPLPVQHWLAGSAHSCLVAQIAYKDAPIQNDNNVVENPGNSDKLAQRNLQVTTSGNPGFPATHRVPQTIDVRPSPPPQSPNRFSVLSYPDEIMIDWGETPLGSVASIYWPAVNVSSVLQLAKQLYSTHTLSAPDAHTVQCKVVSPVTYIPIPRGTGGSFPGLLTVDLPTSVRYGDEFNVVVRRISTKQLVTPTGTNDTNTQTPPRAAAVVKTDRLLWRYVTGSYLARISVQKESRILPADENLLAILKWRLGLIGSGNRWYPVLLRYISYLSGRINNMGGNAFNIQPSPSGYQPASTGPGKHAHVHCHTATGKIEGIVYDRFGDFEGFRLLTEEGHKRDYFSREAELEALARCAWLERNVITVVSEPHEPDIPVKLILLRTPPPQP